MLDLCMLTLDVDMHMVIRLDLTKIFQVAHMATIYFNQCWRQLRLADFGFYHLYCSVL